MDDTDIEELIGLVLTLGKEIEESSKVQNLVSPPPSYTVISSF